MKLVLLFDEILERISRYGLIICLFSILTMAVLSIVLRWLGMSLLWMEPLIRHLVFLSAFLGGSLATSKGVHIKVDILTHLVEKSESKVIKWFHQNLVTLFCLITCLILTTSGWDFYIVEKEYGTLAFLGLHSSWMVGIIPFGMGLIALRFFNKLIIGLGVGEVREHHRI